MASLNEARRPSRRARSKTRKHSGHSQSQRLGSVTTLPLIQQQLAGVHLNSERNCLGLPSVEVPTQYLRQGLILYLPDLQPAIQLRIPDGSSARQLLINQFFVAAEVA